MGTNEFCGPRRVTSSWPSLLLCASGSFQMNVDVDSQSYRDIYAHIWIAGGPYVSVGAHLEQQWPVALTRATFLTRRSFPPAFISTSAFWVTPPARPQYGLYQSSLSVLPSTIRLFSPQEAPQLCFCLAQESKNRNYTTFDATLESGITVFHFPVCADENRPLNYTHEYQAM